MSDKERHEQGRAEATRHDLGSSEDTEQDTTPDVEAHRFETGSDKGRNEQGRNDLGTEPEDRHRNDLGT